MIVFDSQGKPVLAIGSPGGSRIICYVAKVLVEVLDWGGELEKAVGRGNLCNRGKASEIEVGSALAGMVPALTAMGHRVKLSEMNSGLHGVMFVEDGLVGAADPRREGDVRGH
jgi:gamma-glutamyltranspeptidase/glutathione hydrolase